MADLQIDELVEWPPFTNRRIESFWGCGRIVAIVPAGTLPDARWLESIGIDTLRFRAYHLNTAMPLPEVSYVVQYWKQPYPLPSYLPSLKWVRWPGIRHISDARFAKNVRTLNWLNPV